MDLEYRYLPIEPSRWNSAKPEWLRKVKMVLYLPGVKLSPIDDDIRLWEAVIASRDIRTYIRYAVHACTRVAESIPRVQQCSRGLKGF